MKKAIAFLLLFLLCGCGARTVPDGTPAPAPTEQAEPVPTPSVLETARVVPISESGMEIRDLTDYMDPTADIYLGFDEAWGILYLDAANKVCSISLSGGAPEIRFSLADELRAGRYLSLCFYCEDWLVWSESEDEFWSDFTTGKNWSLHAANLKTGEVVPVDAENEWFPADRSFDARPLDVSCGDGLIAFYGYEADSAGVSRAIKVYDLARHELKTVHRTPEGRSGGWDTAYSAPRIASRCVFFCKSYHDPSRYVTKYSQLFSYDAVSGETMELRNDLNLRCPAVSADYIVARNNASPDETLYAFSLAAGEWFAIADRTSPIDIAVSKLRFPEVQIYDHYVTWRTGIDDAFYLYDLDENIFYELFGPEDGREGGWFGTMNSRLLWWVDTDHGGQDARWSFVLLE